MEDNGKLWNTSKIIKVVQILYEDSECAVLDEGEESEWFKGKNWSITRRCNVWFYFPDCD